MSKTLIINSASVSRALVDIVYTLEQRGYSFYLLTNQKDLLSFTEKKKDNKLARKVFLGPSLDHIGKVYAFILLLPFLCLKQCLNLLYFKYRLGVTQVICVNWNEKIMISPLARLLRLKVLWVELPTVNYENKPTLVIKMFRSSSKKVEFIVFLKADKFKLTELGINFDRIHMIPPAIDVEEPGEQDDIFSTLARSEYSEKNHDVFTVGVVDFDHSPQVENLFMAAKKSLDIIPELRIIVIGKKKEKEYLNWLTRQMGIENLVWLVGEQEDLRKWMRSFDVFVGLSESPDVFELEVALKAMSVGMPVVGLRNKGYEELIEENKTGILVSQSDSEIMAQRIIKLYQDNSLRQYLGENGGEKVFAQYSREKQVNKLEKVLG